jgi:chaperone BCS1
MRHILDNQLFVGLVGAMLTGSVLFLFKAIPTQLFWAVIHAVTVEVAVDSSDDSFAWIAEWLGRHSYSKKARRLTLGASRLDDERWMLSPGHGKHVLWFRGRPVLIDRELKEKQPGDPRPRQVITIKAFGRDQAFLRALIQEADGLRTRRDRLEARIWCDGWWQPLPKRDKRSLDTVFLPAAMKAAMVRHIRWFFDAPRWYAARGIPHRLGWLFTGGPGTGKTSTVMALAAEFDLPIYYLNLSTVENDNALVRAFIAADKRCLLLLEDVDATGLTAARAPAPVEQTSSPGQPTPKLEERRGVTLSGLLNAIDGVGSPDGRLLIMTHQPRGEARPGADPSRSRRSGVRLRPRARARAGAGDGAAVFS